MTWPARSRRLGFAPSDFYDDSIYPLLEQPLPWLCADRLDYFLRDGSACGVVQARLRGARAGLSAVVDGKLALGSVDVAREAVALFETMNRQWWAGPVEAYIYNEFADALREGIRTGILQFDDLMTDDAFVLARLDSSGNALIAEKLASVRLPRPELGACLLAAHHSQGAVARPSRAAQRHRQAAFLARIRTPFRRCLIRITNDRRGATGRVLCQQSAASQGYTLARPRSWLESMSVDRPATA